MTMTIQHSTDPEQIETLVAMGYCPVECSIDGKSIIDDLAMDHHGDNSDLEGVAIRAYRDHYGARRDDQRFVVTGAADADATFAIAALCGMLPHPSNDTEGKPWLAGFDRDISSLASLVNEIDVDPISGAPLSERGRDGAILLAFNAMGSSNQDDISFFSGIDRWRWLTGRPSEALIQAALVTEQERVDLARSAKIETISENIVFAESEAWGFDIWYREHAPIVFAHNPQGNVTVGARSLEDAERVFGEGGLKNLFSVLPPKGWGGRETIGGSPRGVRLERAEALFAAKFAATEERAVRDRRTKALYRCDQP